MEEGAGTQHTCTAELVDPIKNQGFFSFFLDSY